MKPTERPVLRKTPQPLARAARMAAASASEGGQPGMARVPSISKNSSFGFMNSPPIEENSCSHFIKNRKKWQASNENITTSFNFLPGAFFRLCADIMSVMEL